MDLNGPFSWTDARTPGLGPPPGLAWLHLGLVRRSSTLLVCFPPRLVPPAGRPVHRGREVVGGGTRDCPATPTDWATTASCRPGCRGRTPGRRWRARPRMVRRRPPVAGARPRRGRRQQRYADRPGQPGHRRARMLRHDRSGLSRVVEVGPPDSGWPPSCCRCRARVGAGSIWSTPPLSWIPCCSCAAPARTIEPRTMALAALSDVCNNRRNRVPY